MKRNLKRQAANAGGIATALGFLATEAKAGIELFTPEIPISFASDQISFDPTSSDVGVGLFLHEISLFSCGTIPYIADFCTTNDFDVFFQSCSVPVASGFEFSASDLADLACSNSLAFCTPSSGDYFLGFGFRSAGSSDFYNLGWVELNSAGSDQSVVQWAYETVAGESIEVGAIPEPSMAALALAGTAVAAVALRRRHSGQRAHQSTN